MKTFFIDQLSSFQDVTEKFQFQGESVCAFLSQKEHGIGLCFSVFHPPMAYTEAVLRERLFLSYLLKHLGDGFYRLNSKLYFFEKEMTESKIHMVPHHTIFSVELFWPVTGDMRMMQFEDHAIPAKELAVLVMQDYSAEITSLNL